MIARSQATAPSWSNEQIVRITANRATASWRVEVRYSVCQPVRRLHAIAFRGDPMGFARDMTMLDMALHTVDETE